MPMKHRGSRRKPPSRERYEAEHPTISMRLTRDLRDKLDERRALEGKSYPSIVRDALEIHEAVDETYNRGFENGRRQGEAEGYKRGFTDGRRCGDADGYKRGLSKAEADVRRQFQYVVTLRCLECGDDKIIHKVVD